MATVREPAALARRGDLDEAVGEFRGIQPPQREVLQAGRVGYVAARRVSIERRCHRRVPPAPPPFADLAHAQVEFRHERVQQARLPHPRLAAEHRDPSREASGERLQPRPRFHARPQRFHAERRVLFEPASGRRLPEGGAGARQVRCMLRRPREVRQIHLVHDEEGVDAAQRRKREQAVHHEEIGIGRRHRNDDRDLVHVRDDHLLAPLGDTVPGQRAASRTEPNDPHLVADALQLDEVADRDDARVRPFQAPAQRRLDHSRRIVHVIDPTRDPQHAADGSGGPTGSHAGLQLPSGVEEFTRSRCPRPSRRPVPRDSSTPAARTLCGPETSRPPPACADRRGRRPTASLRLRAGGA